MTGPDARQAERDPFNAVAALMADHLAGDGNAAILTGQPGAAMTATLQAILGPMPGTVIRVANPLATPLTLHRILLQIDAAELPPVETGAQAARLIHALTAQALPVGPSILAIEDAQTLDDDALRFAASLPGVAHPDHAGFKVLLAGSPGLPERIGALSLRALIDPPAAYHEALLPPPALAAAVVPSVARPITAAVPSPPAPVRAPPRPAMDPAMHRAAPPIAPRPRRRRGAGLVVGVAAAGAIGFAAVVMAARFDILAPGPVPEAAPPIAIAAPAPDLAPPPDAASLSTAAQVAPAPPASAPMPPAPVGLPSADAEIVEAARRADTVGDHQLRADFAAFLRRTGQEAVARDHGAREALLREYKSWLAQAKPRQ